MPVEFYGFLYICWCQLGFILSFTNTTGFLWNICILLHFLRLKTGTSTFKMQAIGVLLIPHHKLFTFHLATMVAGMVTKATHHPSPTYQMAISTLPNAYRRSRALQVPHTILLQFLLRCYRTLIIFHFGTNLIIRMVLFAAPMFLTTRARLHQ